MNISEANDYDHSQMPKQQGINDHHSKCMFPSLKYSLDSLDTYQLNLISYFLRKFRSSFVLYLAQEESLDQVKLCTVGKLSTYSSQIYVYLLLSLRKKNC